ncbi:TonB-dependent receptor family protein [Zavarzinia compransoris]|uniref:TonB-dependent receptor n=1 Tax=Zavarzinia compransoris TaxID=1264899 RepID=A0A317E0U9_9PROT|nr:TonB-dependent receptor [Zavarzinia compransoris]PWR20678.1 TonB-dependent receptor [Zavarzinia compransoris]TDP44500.1 iron complex outermembrane receptor protein [Zavarzinia compransoris]
MPKIRFALVSLPALLAALPAAAQDVLPTVSVSAGAVSLTAPDAAAAAGIIARTPGAAAVVPAEDYADTPAATLKDIFDYEPGVFVQPKWGGDARFSIRGSGLSRNFHLRGIQLFQDGIPMIFADGSGDAQEIDPTAYDHVEVWKGGNGLRYGANSTGGAVNFVTPSGHDASLISGRAVIGSDGFRQLQLASGTASGAVDVHATGSWLQDDGFRDHADGESFRGSANLGWRLSPRAETRFYVNASDIEQYIPGSVGKAAALNRPRTAAAGNLTQDYQRNIEALRFANKTTVILGETSLEVGFYASEKQLVHPIYQYLDYKYRDQGLFARVENEGRIFGHDNRLTLGLSVAGGRLDNAQYQNLPGARQGALLSKAKDKAETTSLYVENAFDVVPGLALVIGGQYIRASREREAIFNTAGGDIDLDAFNPKLGLLFDISAGWQVFANVTKATEMPSFGELNFAQAALSNTRPQTALTYEIGTRGATADHEWDITLYHSRLRREFLFEDLGGGLVAVANADRTLHQGLEAGFGLTVAKALFVEGDQADRVWLRGAYTFSDFRFDGDRVFGDNELPGAPRHMLRAELLYRNPAGYAFGPNVEWVPEAYYVDNANRTETASYALLGFSAGYDLSRHVSLFFEGRNLLDEAYIASASTGNTATDASAVFEPGSGRALFLGAHFNW